MATKSKNAKNSDSSVVASNLSYRELLNQSDKDRAEAQTEIDVTTASFSMQSAIVDAERQVALQSIEVNRAELALATAKTLAVSNQSQVERNIPFKASAILAQMKSGKESVGYAEDDLTYHQEKLKQFEEQLATLQGVQSRLFPG